MDMRHRIFLLSALAHGLVLVLAVNGLPARSPVVNPPQALQVSVMSATPMVPLQSGQSQQSSPQQKLVQTSQAIPGAPAVSAQKPASLQTTAAPPPALNPSSTHRQANQHTDQQASPAQAAPAVSVSNTPNQASNHATTQATTAAATPSGNPAPAGPDQTATNSANPSANPIANPGTRQGVSISATYAASNPVPPYPAIARRLGEQGTVILRVLVAADGSAREIQIKKSSGSPTLDRSAETTIKQWRFNPAKIDGKPVEEWYETRWTFKLEG